MTYLTEKLDRIQLLERKVKIQKDLYLEKALLSDDVNAILKAKSIVSPDIQQRDESAERKGYVIDPMDFASSMGYKDKRTSMSYDMLAKMARTPIISAIIKTLTNQVASFCEPQKDKYSTGFVIVKKPKIRGQVAKMTRQEQVVASDLTDTILSCGKDSSWQGDDFDAFTRKCIKDSLTFDQMTFEIVPDRKGVPYKFTHMDSSTIRLADSFDEDTYGKGGFSTTYGKQDMVKGYYPSYVQLDNGTVYTDFYPWELCFGMRNPDTSVFNYGYGESELEDLIQTVTAILWSEDYNRRFFSQGSMPKGMLKVSKDVSPASLQAFKQQWLSMVSGVQNSWKTPILEADKFEYINLQTNSRDMEYQHWIEYLVKLSTAIYCIDPSEINFDISGSSNKSMFESNNEARLNHSKSKGLNPILKFYAAKLNKYVVSRINPEYELQFVGMDAPSRQEELDSITKKVTNYMTLNEVREEAGLKKLPNGDIVLNGIYSQQIMMAQQQQMMSQQGQQQDGTQQDQQSLDDGNPYSEEDQNPFQ